MYKTGYEWPDWVVPAATRGPIGRGVRSNRGEGEGRGEGKGEGGRGGGVC